MKIKTQSAILMLGIVIMPVLVISLFFVVERISFKSREMSRYEELKLEGEARSDGEIIARVIKEKPEGIGMAIGDPGGKVAYSTIGAIPAGSDFSSSLMAASRRPSREKMLVLGFAPELPEGYSAITELPRTEFLPSKLLVDYIAVGILALAAILAFAAGMSALMLRSITRSVLSLEAATRRVAAGELDRPIVVEGSNEIASLSRSLDSLREEIKDDQARRARFVMGISHDLKTPLSLVKGYAEALEELGDPGPEASSYLDVIQRKADQLEGMIDDLIDFERVGTGEWRTGLESVDLGAFLRAYVKRVEADAALLGRELKGSIDLPAGSLLRMDERLTSRAMENLVNNALRYTPEGGKVRVSARAEAARYVVSVADDGPGISSADLPHIFEPFYRGSSSRLEQGMGLGLSIVKTVVESQGWEIEVARGRESGAMFAISMPREPSA